MIDNEDYNLFEPIKLLDARARAETNDCPFERSEALSHLLPFPVRSVALIRSRMCMYIHSLDSKISRLHFANAPIRVMLYPPPSSFPSLQLQSLQARSLAREPHLMRFR